MPFPRHGTHTSRSANLCRESWIPLLGWFPVPELILPLCEGTGTGTQGGTQLHPPPAQLWALLWEEDEQFPVSLCSSHAGGQERGRNHERKMYPGREGVWDGGRTFVTPEGKRLPRAVLQPPPWVHGSLPPQSRAFLGCALEPLLCGLLGETQQQRALIGGDVLLCLWRAQGSVAFMGNHGVFTARAKSPGPATPSS